MLPPRNSEERAQLLKDLGMEEPVGFLDPAAARRRACEARAERAAASIVDGQTKSLPQRVEIRIDMDRCWYVPLLYCGALLIFGALNRALRNPLNRSVGGGNV